MDKDTGIFYKGTLLSRKKEGNFNIWSNMDGLGGIMVSEVRHIKTNTTWYHLHVESESTIK